MLVESIAMQAVYMTIEKHPEYILYPIRIGIDSFILNKI